MGRFITFKDGVCKEITFEEISENIGKYCDEADRMYLDNYTTILEYNNSPYIDIAYSLTKDDYQNIMNTISNFTPKEQQELEIVDHNIRDGFEDYDKFEYSTMKYVMKLHKDKYSEEEYNAILENRNPKNVVSVFLRNKVGMLTEEEKEMYKKYTTFDLDMLLFEEDMEKLVLNTDNSGFISIFEDCTFKSNNTTDAHSETEKKHINWYNKEHTGNFENHIAIHIFKGVVAMYIPNDINDYQKQELSNFIEEVDDLCKFHNKDILMEAEVYVKNNNDYLVPATIDDEVIKQYNSLEQVKQDFVIKKEGKNK